jgi:uncharacterized membrane protein YqhA
MTMFSRLLQARYVFLIAVVFLLLNSIIFILAGAVHSFHGIIEFIELGFLPDEESRPGLHLLEGLDMFMVALVFLIFGLGIARLFIFDKIESSQIPSWLNIRDLKGLKILLWETILVTLVILCVTNLVKHPARTWEALIFPIIILILTLALYLMRGKDSH